MNKKTNEVADRSWIGDSVLLIGVVLISVIPYIAGLGFYSDDWWSNSLLAQNSANGLGAMVRTLFKADPEMLLRPVQAIYLALGFKAFGLNPVPYQVFDSMVVGIATVFLYLAVREMQGRRMPALATAVVFGLLPHYSTDRFWVTMHVASLGFAFACCGVYALWKSMNGEGGRSKLWLILALVTMGLSILAYEVTFGVIAGAVAIAGWRMYKSARASSRSVFSAIGSILCLGAVLLLVVLAKARMQTRVTYHHHFFSRLWRLLGHGFSQAIQFNLWTYGLHMPVVLVGLYRHSALSGAAVCTAILVGVLIAAYLWRTLDSSSLPTPAGCLWLVLVGFVVFALGYGLFLPSIEMDFSTMGLANRVAIASAPGAACILVAFAGLLSLVFKSQVARVRGFSLTIGAICGLNCLVVSGIAHFWVDGARQQAAVMRSVKDNVPALPHGSVLLLDGFCRYIGPGIVFEGDDVAGSLQLAFGDFSLNGDVISPNMHFGDATVETIMYGQPEATYHYGNTLLVYNVQRKTLSSLPSKDAADAYLRAANPTGDGGCPPAHEGDGAKVY